MNNKIYIEKLVKRQYNNIKADKQLSKLISEEYNKIKEDASTIRNTLDDVGYDEKASEIDSGGKMQSHATKLFAKFFRFLKQEVPEAKIVITGGNDNFHQRLKIGSRHQTGEAIDFIVKNKKLVPDVVKACRKFRSKNRQFKYIDEYTHPSPHATGGHFHIAYIGSESVYDKTKPTRGNANPNTPGIDEPEELQSGINLWTGEDDNGTSLEELDKILLDFSKSAKGRTNAKLIKFRYGNEESHKWQVSAVIRAPENVKKNLGVPNEDGILPASPETITFYPSGGSYFYNKMSVGGDVEIEDKNKFWQRILNIVKYTANLYTIPAWFLGDKAVNMISTKVITIYNNSADLIGSLYADKKYGLVFDISESPQFALDDEGNVKYGHGKGLDQLQTVLDVIGFIPVVGDIVDIVNAVIYYFRGRNFEAALSIIAVIPVVGSVIKWGAKGALKVGKAQVKVGGELLTKGFNKLGVTKALFKKGKTGVKEFENILTQLVDKKVLDASDLKWLSTSDALNVISKKISKSRSVFKKYLSKEQFNLLDDGLKNMDGAFVNLKKAVQNMAGDTGKFIGPKGIATKLTNSPGTWIGKAWNKVARLIPLKRSFRYITQTIIGKIPPKRARLIDEWIVKTVRNDILKDPGKLRTLMRTLSPKALQELGIPAKQINNFKKGFTPKSLRPDQLDRVLDIAQKDGNLFLESMMNNPQIYFRSQMSQGLRSMQTGGGFYKVLRSALGPKTLDVLYNEVKAVLNKELGLDVGSYGNESESLVYYTIFSLFRDEQKRTQQVNQVDGVRQQIRDLAGNLAWIPGLNIQDVTLDIDRTQIEVADQMWNEIPGETDQDKLILIKNQTTDPDILKPVIQYLKIKNKKDD